MNQKGVGRKPKSDKKIKNNNNNSNQSEKKKNMLFK